MTIKTWTIGRSLKKDGTLGAWRVTTKETDNPITFEGTYTEAQAEAKRLSDTLPKPVKNTVMGRPVTIKEGTGFPRTVNVPDELWDSIPVPKSVFVRDAIREKLKEK